MQLNRVPYCEKCVENGRFLAINDPEKEKLHVDHIIPLSEGGSNSLDNLQTLCQSHHSSKTARENDLSGSRDRAKNAFRVTIVAGPPGSGKSSYVRKRAKWGDLIIDYDEIMAALSGLKPYDAPRQLTRYVAAARDALYREIERDKGLRHAWIIATAADRSLRDTLRLRFQARVLVLEEPPMVCLQRIQADERRKNKWRTWEQSINRWWREYDPL